MKALVYIGLGKVLNPRAPKPTIQAATDAIIKLLYASICGTDLHILEGGLHYIVSYYVDCWWVLGRWGWLWLTTRLYTLALNLGAHVAVQASDQDTIQKLLELTKATGLTL